MLHEPVFIQCVVHTLGIQSAGPEHCTPSPRNHLPSQATSYLGASLTASYLGASSTTSDLLPLRSTIHPPSLDSTTCSLPPKVPPAASLFHMSSATSSLPLGYATHRPPAAQPTSWNYNPTCSSTSLSCGEATLCSSAVCNTAGDNLELSRNNPVQYMNRPMQGLYSHVLSVNNPVQNLAQPQTIATPSPDLVMQPSASPALCPTSTDMAHGAGGESPLFYNSCAPKGACGSSSLPMEFINVQLFEERNVTTGEPKPPLPLIKLQLELQVQGGGAAQVGGSSSVLGFNLDIPTPPLGLAPAPRHPALKVHQGPVPAMHAKEKEKGPLAPT